MKTMGKRQFANAVTSYDADFFQWTRETADLIRRGRVNEADLEHVAVEIEDMGKRDQREVRSRTAVLLAHLLKWQFQPELRTPSWRSTVIEQRSELRLIFDDSPSLRRIAETDLQSIYERAVRVAADETGLGPQGFPGECPYSLSQVLDADFFTA